MVVGVLDIGRSVLRHTRANQVGVPIDRKDYPLMTPDTALTLLSLGVLKDIEQIHAAIAWHDERKNRQAAWESERELLKQQVHVLSDTAERFRRQLEELRDRLGVR